MWIAMDDGTGRIWNGDTTFIECFFDGFSQITAHGKTTATIFGIYCCAQLDPIVTQIRDHYRYRLLQRQILTIFSRIDEGWVMDGMITDDIHGFINVIIISDGKIKEIGFSITFRKNRRIH